MTEEKECLPCRVGKNLCRLLDRDGKGRCQQIYEAIQRGEITGGQGKQILEEAFGAERVEEASKLATEITRRAKTYEEAMLQFLGSEGKESASE